MSDRPVSLRAVLSELAMVDAIPVDDHSRIVDRLRALPTFAPATPAAPKSVDEMAAEMGLTVADLVRLHAEHTAPTKLPREMPAPKPGMVVCLAPDVEIQCRHSGWGTWRAFLRAECVDTETVTITRIYWPGPTPVVIWERA